MSADPLDTVMRALKLTEQHAMAAGGRLAPAWTTGREQGTGRPQVQSTVRVAARGGDWPVRVPVATVTTWHEVTDPECRALADHIALWNPHATMTLVRGLRRLLALHHTDEETGLCRTCGLDGQELDCSYPCDTVRVLAQALASLLHQPVANPLDPEPSAPLPERSTR